MNCLTWIGSKHVVPRNIDFLNLKPGHCRGSTSNTPLVGKSCAPNAYSTPWTTLKIEAIRIQWSEKSVLASYIWENIYKICTAATKPKWRKSSSIQKTWQFELPSINNPNITMLHIPQLIHCWWPTAFRCDSLRGQRKLNLNKALGLVPKTCLLWEIASKNRQDLTTLTDNVDVCLLMDSW